MDTALREILKEEKRRKEERSKKEQPRKDQTKKDQTKKDRSKKEHSQKDRKHRSRSEPRKPKSASIEIGTPRDAKLENSKPDEEKFMFVYENSDGELFSKLDKISKKEGDKIKIFPVYVAGYHNNLNEEEVTFQNGKLVSEEENSWLSIIESFDPKISVLDFELSNVVVYNGKLFHCEDDLIAYLSEEGGDVLPVN